MLRLKQTLRALRNTYLMGSGELYQSIINEILICIERGTASVESEEVMLQRIMCTTARQFDLDEEAFQSVLQIKRYSPTSFHADPLTDHSGVELSGSCRANKNGRIELMTNDSERLGDLFTQIWSDQQEVRRVINDGASAPFGEEKIQTTGSLWISEPKYLAKGFTASVEFSGPADSELMQMTRSLTTDNISSSSSSVLPHGSIVLGTVSFVIRSDNEESSLISAHHSRISAGVDYVAIPTIGSTVEDSTFTYSLRVYILSTHSQWSTLRSVDHSMRF